MFTTGNFNNKTNWLMRPSMKKCVFEATASTIHQFEQDVFHYVK